MANNENTRLVLTFDGQDDYIDFGKNDINGAFAEGSSAFTVSGWINPQQLTGKASTYGTHNVFFARSSDRYSDNFEFGISETGNLEVYLDVKVVNPLKTLGNGELTVGQWHFFAIIFNQGQLTIYLDGHEYTDSLPGSFLNKASSHITLGATLHNSIYFTGQLANISVWNYSCSSTEIQTQRSQPLAGNEAGLLAYWILDDGKGITIRDRTESTHNGKLRGNPIWNSVEFPFMVKESSGEDEKQGETASSLEKSSSLKETAVFQEESSTQGAIAQAPTTREYTVQREKEKIAEVQPENTSDPLTSQAKAEEVEIVQTGQSEILVSPQVQEQSETLTHDESQDHLKTAATRKYKILAIDGGGIRSIIPALILAEIEKRTQKQIFSLFDLIAGTSTGGILALGLTKPRLNPASGEGEPMAEYSAQELAKLLVEYGVDVFYEPLFEKILGPLEDVFIRPKYSSEEREEILKRYFGDALLENNLKEVFVTSYDLEQRIPVFFTNKLAKQQTEPRNYRRLCGGFTLTNAALATSATPTYFAPHRIAAHDNANRFYTLVDGGLVANNPANLALSEARVSSQKKTSVLNPEDFLVVSLGTGSLTSAYSYHEAKNWGLLQWAMPLLSVAFDGSSDVVAGELERLFEANHQATKNYYRFQAILTNETEAIDNVKPDNIRKLKAIARCLIDEKSQEIDELCSLLLDSPA